MWRSDTGERLGTYDGHTGAVYQVDVTRELLLVVKHKYVYLRENLFVFGIHHDR